MSKRLRRVANTCSHGAKVTCTTRTKLESLSRWGRLKSPNPSPFKITNHRLSKSGRPGVESQRCRRRNKRIKVRKTKHTQKNVTIAHTIYYLKITTPAQNWNIMESKLSPNLSGLSVPTQSSRQRLNIKNPKEHLSQTTLFCKKNPSAQRSTMSQQNDHNASSTTT